MRDRFLLFVLAFGFAVVALELNELHRFVVKYYQIAWLPIIFCWLAFLLCLIAGFAKKPKLRKWMGVPLLAGLVIGPVGFWNHIEGEFEHLEGLLVPAGRQVDPDDEEEEQYHGEDAPPLAPLSLTGLSLMGAMICLWDERKGRAKN